MADIKLHDSENVFSDTARPCLICNKNSAQYTCPRCTVKYCSLACYKSHSGRCTESFYQERIQEELEQQKPTDEDRQRMMETLVRFEQQQLADSEDNDTESEYAQLRTLSKAERIDIEQLPLQQQEEFKKSLRDGRLSDKIQLWTAWWDSDPSNPSQAPPVITVLAGNDNDHDDDDESTPSGPVLVAAPASVVPLPFATALPSLASLTTALPSSLLPLKLVEIIYGYALILRLYNGEPQVDAVEAVMCLTDVVPDLLPPSRVKKSAHADTTLPLVLQNTMQRILQTRQVHANVAMLVALVRDTATIFQSEHFVSAALADLHRLCDVAIAQTASETEELLLQVQREQQQHSQQTHAVGYQTRTVQRQKAAAADLRRTQLVQKKVYFFAVWWNEVQPQKCVELHMSLLREYEAQSTRLEQSLNIGKQ
eukprot:TRINITY_DN4757_c0_g1_i1.p1 TRINITY_DN4757_c0_g1~~TRINITY_DN4757_c0_g1_i1.p1  ORF type:complete len:425 (+),score=94.93 TRINITY_DN4757_c0_g1_i1:25-1299(+)